MTDDLNWMQRYAASEMVELNAEGRLSRREMMGRLVAICGTAGAAGAFLAACASDGGTGAPAGSSAAQRPTGGPGGSGGSVSAPPAAPGSTVARTVATDGPPGHVLSVAADDPAVRAEALTFPGPVSPIIGYLARPAREGTRPGVLVIHEIFGLTDHIRDVTRRLAKAGYLALAVDLASRAGGTDKAPNVMGALTQGPVEERVADLDAAFAHLRAQPDFNGRLGVTGFCFGGGMTLSYAAGQPAVLAAVPYYGPTPQPASTMARTNAAILAHYGEDDARVNASIGSLEEAMRGKVFEKRVHAGAGHAFNNDTGGAYDEAVAVAAWTDTLAWFATHLGA